MKRYISILVAFLLMLGMLGAYPTVGVAEEYEGTCGERVTWRFEPSSGTLIIEGDGEMADNMNMGWKNLKPQIIHAQIGEGVTHIGLEAFYECENLMDVKLPDSLQSVGNGAFRGCRVLREISIPNGVTNIHMYAFLGCESLTKVGLPPKLTTIDESSFAFCSQLKEVSIPEGVYEISDDAFNGCASLSEVTLPLSLRVLGEGAFVCCNSLSYIVIPEGVTELPRYVFGVLDRDTGMGLHTIVIPRSVKRIHEHAFMNSGIKEIYYAGTEDEWKNILIDAPETDVRHGWQRYVTVHYDVTTEPPRPVVPDTSAYHGECGEGISWTFQPEDGTFTVSGKGAMEDDNNSWQHVRPYIRKAVVEDGVTRISAYTFFGCNELEEVSLPDTVTEIGRSAFSGCSQLKEIFLPPGITAISDRMCNGCKSLTAVRIPDGVVTVGEGAFLECENLETVFVGESVTSIGDHAFDGCKNLSSIQLPEGLQTLGTQTFFGCMNLSFIRIPPKVTALERYVFGKYRSDEGGLREIVIPKSVTEIHEDAFWGTNLQNIYYAGTKEDWQNIKIIKNDTDFHDLVWQSASVHYEMEAKGVSKYFADVGEPYTWAAGAIDAMTEKGIIRGMEDGTFAPGKPLTRAQLAALLVRLYGLEEDAANHVEFTDVADEAWYFDSIHTMASLGIINGYEDGSARPDQTLTREEMATVVSRLLISFGEEPVTAETVWYWDHTKVSDYAKPHVRNLMERGIMTGMGDHYFEPKKPVTRAQAAVILYRLWER